MHASGWGGGRALGCGFAALLAACSVGSRPPDAGSFDVPLIPPEGGPECEADHECADRVACTIDRCIDGACDHRPCADCCDEGLTCIPGFGCRTAPTPCSADEECSDAVRCTLDYCRSGACAHDPQPALCDPGEICLPAVGCIPEPPTTCESVADCEEGGAICVGQWSCDPEFGCQFVALRDCDDGDACTVDACEEPDGCVHRLRDADGDGHADAACGGDDCDDADPSVHPGELEVCGFPADEDCDGMVDEGCCVEGVPCATGCGDVAGTVVCEGGVPRCEPPPEVCNGLDDDCDGASDEDFECARGATMACATSCGSTGTSTCGDACTWGACVPPAETCNALDDDCNGEADEVFACVRGTTSSCPTMCGSTGSRVCLPDCTFDLCVPPAEVCNGADDDCDGACDDGFACCEGATRPCSALGFFAGTATCPSGCGGWDTSTCTNCGDGDVDAGEECDSTDLGGASCTSIGMGFGGGTLRCGAGCRFDTSECTRCGNGAIDAGEQCDGPALGGASCASLGFTGGALACGPTCAFDTSGCTRCGNGVVEPGEACDDGNVTPGDGCSATCTVEECDPDGTYVITGGPVSYTCCFGLVNVNVSSFTFSADGALVVSSPSSPASMTGSATTCPSGSFVNSGSITGGCTETYTLRGSFTGPDTWSGTYELSFSGPDCACFGGIGAPCVSQVFPITATR